MPTPCTVSGVILDASGAPLPGAILHWSRQPPVLSSNAQGAVWPQPIVSQADDDGVLTVALLPGNYVVQRRDAADRPGASVGAVVPATLNASLGEVLGFEITDVAPPVPLFGSDGAQLFDSDGSALQAAGG